MISLKSVNYLFFKGNLSLNNKESTIKALTDIDMEIEKGTTTIIYGPSGSGKTTLIKIISLLLRPLTGEITFNDVNPYILSKKEFEILISNYIGYLDQDPSNNLLDSLSVREILNLCNYNLNDELIKFEIKNLFNSLGLSLKILDTKVNLLSGGEKQRFGFLFLILKNPEILLLDEPTSHLDNTNQIKMVEMLLKFKKKGKTLIISTHDPQLLDIADRIIVLKDGRIKTLSSLNFLSGLTFQPIKFTSRINQSDSSIIIPDEIHRQLEMNKIYILDFLNDKKNIFTFVPIGIDLFKKKEIEKWVFIENKAFKIPDPFVQKLKNYKFVIWEVYANDINIKFEV